MRVTVQLLLQHLFSNLYYMFHHVHELCNSHPVTKNKKTGKHSKQVSDQPLFSENSDMLSRLFVTRVSDLWYRDDVLSFTSHRIGQSFSSGHLITFLNDHTIRRRRERRWNGIADEVVDNGALLSRAAPALDFSPPTCTRYHYQQQQKQKEIAIVARLLSRIAEL